MKDKEILQEVYEKLLRERDVKGEWDEEGNPVPSDDNLPATPLCVRWLINFIEEEWQKEDERGGKTNER